MQLQNPYTRGYIEYPLNFDLEKLHFHIRHETPFTDRWSEWAVSILDNADMIYIPYGQNRCRNIYIVTYFYTSKQVERPHGIYIIPMSTFTTPKITFSQADDDFFDDFDDEDFDKWED